MEAGGPVSLKIEGKDSIVITDVLVGEVWLASGQSNMEYSMGSLKGFYKEEILGSKNDNIRFFTVGKASSAKLEDDVEAKGWKSANSENILEFSAVAYFFAKQLYQEHEVPVGIVNSSYGGTAVERWISENGLKSFPIYDSILYKIKNTVETAESVKDRQKQWSVDILNEFDYRKINSDNWKKIVAPETFEARAYPDADGLFWLKKTVDLPEGFESDTVYIHLGTIDDVDATFVNGHFVGNGTWWDQLRIYMVEGQNLKSGKNEIAIAVADFASNGGFGGEPHQMKMVFTGDTISLTGEWECTFVTANGGFPGFPFSLNMSVPAGLFNGMIHPVLGYGMKGVIWYQGEANTSTPSRAEEYARLFPAMIDDWREKKGNHDWPFLFVQLANYNPRQNHPSESNWAILRESQLKTLSVDNTAMVVTIDIGEANDIHPKNKKEVGNRLFLAAEKIAYGKDLIYSGPVFDSLAIENHEVKLYFTRVGSGLATIDKKTPEGFAIAGSDSVFYWADNTSFLNSNSVIISSSKVADPMFVRYAWADNPACNLCNKEGLPASPFRTDDF